MPGTDSNTSGLRLEDLKLLHPGALKLQLLFLMFTKGGGTERGAAWIEKDVLPGKAVIRQGVKILK